MSDYSERFEDQQDELLPEPVGIELPEWCSWFVPILFLVCFVIGAAVLLKWTVGALVWIVNNG